MPASLEGSLFDSFILGWRFLSERVCLSLGFSLVWRHQQQDNLNCEHQGQDKTGPFVQLKREGTVCKGCVLRRAKWERSSMLIDKLIFLVVIIHKEKSQEREQGETAEQDLAFISVCIDISMK